VLAGTKGPFIAASDHVRALPEQLLRYIPGDYFVLGTDGMGRSETREALRRHFEVDAESVTLAALHRLAKQGVFQLEDVAKAIKELDYNPEKANPLYA
jgi:pyruvate dehydrogenase E1 component